VKGNRHAHTNALTRRAAKREAVPFAVQVSQPLSGAREPNALAMPGAKPATIVDHLAREHVAHATDAHRYRAASNGVAEPVAECVLHQRLQEQIWHASVSRLRGNVDGNREPVTESKRHDLHVSLQEIELGLQRHFLGADVLE
jgi:hypothetical protein